LVCSISITFRSTGVFGDAERDAANAAGIVQHRRLPVNRRGTILRSKVEKSAFLY
jgi:hypothetical protein